jgi:hypothetical protein
LNRHISPTVRTLTVVQNDDSDGNGQTTLCPPHCGSISTSLRAQAKQSSFAGEGWGAPDRKRVLLWRIPPSTALDRARRPPPQAGEVQRRPELLALRPSSRRIMARLRPDHLSANRYHLDNSTRKGTIFGQSGNFAQRIRAYFLSLDQPEDGHVGTVSACGAPRRLCPARPL